jgi:hypothetical protein
MHQEMPDSRKGSARSVLTREAIVAAAYGISQDDRAAGQEHIEAGSAPNASRLCSTLP